MKKKDMTALITGLRQISSDFSQIADALEGIEAPAAATEVTEKEAPESEEVAHEAAADETPAPAEDATPAYSFEDVRGILAGKSRAGKRQQVRELILSYGGNQLSDYKDKPQILTELATKAEEL